LKKEAQKKNQDRSVPPPPLTFPQANERAVLLKLGFALVFR
jgi:hypothetical protein